MLLYPLEDFLQVSLHGLHRGMVDIGKLLDGSLLAPDAEIFPENQVLVWAPVNVSCTVMSAISLKNLPL